MSIALAVNDIVMVTAWCQQGSQASLNVGKFRVSAIAGSPTLDILANAIKANWSPAYTAWMPTSATFEGVKVRRLAPTATPEVLSTGAPDAGTSAGDPLPAQISGLITLRTNLPGPKWRGRKYVGFGTEDNTTTAFAVNGAGVALLDTIATKWGVVQTYGVGNTATLMPIIADRLLPNTNEPVSSYLVRSSLVTQKRRAVLSRPNTSPF